MTFLRRWFLRGALLATVGGVVVAMAAAALDTSQAAEQSGASARSLRGAPSDGSAGLASGALRLAVERLGQGQAAGAGVDVAGDKIRVEILHTLDRADARRLVEDSGGVFEGEAPGLVQALVPVDRLVALEASEGVEYLRPPLDIGVPIDPPAGRAGAATAAGAGVGAEVNKTNAAAWHAAGFIGAGVKIGIVDGFDGSLWDAAQLAGELPTRPAGVFCRINGSSCNIWTDVIGANQGEGAAEVIYEMAPGAQLYLATVGTTADLQAAVDYFAAQGVDVISRSQTSPYDGPGDGTGPIARVIDSAVASGMLWINSAGDAASDGALYGQYWRGQWTDANADGWLEFAPGVQRLAFDCVSANGVRWSDFGAVNPTDYDVYVFDNTGDVLPLATSTDRQTMGALPLETVPCTGGVDYLGISRFAFGNGTAGDVLELMVNNGELAYSQNPYSASGPASDSASPGALSIGAVDPASGTSIAPYSSQGPTNDGRIKPDISVASCVTTFTSFAPDACFRGTNAAAPAAAGAAALVIGAGLATTPAEVKTYLRTRAAVDRGAPGADNVFGAGELILPSLSSSPTATPTVTSTRTQTATPSAARTPTPGVGVRGDATCDGLANSLDSLYILQFYAGLLRVLPCPQNADVNRNGVIDAIDSLLILQLDAGLIHGLPAGA